MTHHKFNESCFWVLILILVMFQLDLFPFFEALIYWMIEETGFLMGVVL